RAKRTDSGRLRSRLARGGRAHARGARSGEQLMALAKSSHWALYTPDNHSPWDLRRVVHLHRRAGFAATWSELQRDLRDGPRAAIDRVLEGRAFLHTPPEFADTAGLLA